MSRPFTVAKAEARELKRRSEKLRRQGGVRHEVVRRAWLSEMTRELRLMIRSYDGSARKARELLEALLIAEEEGAPGVASLRHELAGKMVRKRAA